MKKVRAYVLIIGAVIIAAAGFMLPSVMLRIEDARLAGDTDTYEIDEVDLSLFSNLSIPQKLVLTSTESAQEVSLETGRFMDEDEAKGSAAEFFDILGIDPGDAEPECSVFLKLNDEGESIVLWKLMYVADELDMTFFIDDETGLILAFSMVDKNYDYADEDAETYYAIETDDFYEIIELFLIKYLGVDVVDAYVSDFTDGERNNTVTIYIVDGDEGYFIYAAYYPEIPAVYFNSSEGAYTVPSEKVSEGAVATDKNY